MKKTIKELYTLIGSPFVFDTTITGYPTITGNESNFITYYNTYKEDLDGYFIHEYGKMAVDVEGEDDTEIAENFKDELKSILRVYLDSWARLYYALSIEYNPLYNVDGVTTTVYGNTQKTDNIAQRQRGESIGVTGGSTTEYATAYDSGTEKETGKTEFAENAKSNTYTDNAHIDTYTEATHTDTETRQGNIGVTMSQAMLEAEYAVRKRAFFKDVFKVICVELGAYHIYGGLL